MNASSVRAIARSRAVLEAAVVVISLFVRRNASDEFFQKKKKKEKKLRGGKKRGVPLYTLKGYSVSQKNTYLYILT